VICNAGLRVQPLKGDLMKTIVMLLIGLALAVGGVALARYAEADDAPGGVVIGWVLVIGAVALGVRALQQRKG
jgi:hypothetical protein